MTRSPFLASVTTWCCSTNTSLLWHCLVWGDSDGEMVMMRW